MFAEDEKLRMMIILRIIGFFTDYLHANNRLDDIKSETLPTSSTTVVTLIMHFCFISNAFPRLPYDTNESVALVTDSYVDSLSLLAKSKLRSDLFEHIISTFILTEILPFRK